MHTHKNGLQVPPALDEFFFACLRPDPKTLHENELLLIGSGVGDQSGSGFFLRLVGIEKLGQWFHRVKARQFFLSFY